MTQIHTVLLNPTIDQVLYIDHFTTGQTYKVQENFRFPVGKAISVACALRALEITPRVFALIGQNDLDEYDDFLNEQKIPHDLIAIKGRTRSNITMVDRPGNQSTHIRFPGFLVNQPNLAELMARMKLYVRRDDIVVMAGSLPEGCPNSFIQTLGMQCKAMGAKFIVDTSGDPLKAMKDYNPYLIKGNITEINTILGHTVNPGDELQNDPDEGDLQRFVNACRELTKFHAKYNIITLGRYGSIAVFDHDAYYAAIRLDNAPYTIGCGDSYMAGFLSGILQQKSPKDIMALATACGAANTQILGPGLIKKGDIEKFLPQVIVKKL